MELLAKLGAADALRVFTQAINRGDQRTQKLIHLTESTAQLGLAKLLHRLQNLFQLAAAQKLRLLLQLGDLRHEIRHGALHVIDTLWDGRNKLRTSGGGLQA